MQTQTLETVTEEGKGLKNGFVPDEYPIVVVPRFLQQSLSVRGRDNLVDCEGEESRPQGIALLGALLGDNLSAVTKER